MFTPYSVPEMLNPDFLRGYEAGYACAKEDMERALCGMKATGDYVGTVSTEEACLWDAMPETSPGSGVKVGHIICPCRKCSPRC